MHRINIIFIFFRINSSKLFRPLNPITYKNHYEYEPKYNMPGVKWGNLYFDNYKD